MIDLAPIYLEELTHEEWGRLAHEEISESWWLDLAVDEYKEETIYTAPCVTMCESYFPRTLCDRPEGSRVGIMGDLTPLYVEELTHEEWINLAELESYEALKLCDAGHNITKSSGYLCQRAKGHSGPHVDAWDGRVWET